MSFAVCLTPVSLLVNAQVVLASGDALVFGGKARNMVHSVPKIHSASNEGGSSDGGSKVGEVIELLTSAEMQKLGSLISQISSSNSRDTHAFRMNFNFRRK